jgi:hypothetical protein
MHLPSLSCALACLVAVGCFPYYGNSGAADTGAESAGTPSIVLTKGHSGWMNPRCLDCHRTDSHNDGLVPYQCAVCHGTNGAPPGHGEVAGCSDCHGEPHGSDGFPDPKACLVCHAESEGAR